MPDIPGAVWAALAVLAGVAIYVFSWRATRRSAAAVQILVRGGMALLLALPLALTLLMSAAERVPDGIQKEVAEGPGRDERGAAQQQPLPHEGEADETIAAGPPTAADGGSGSYRPMIVEPPPGTAPTAMPEATAPEEAPVAPPAAPPIAPPIAPMAREEAREEAQKERAAPRTRAAASAADVDESFQVVPVFYGTDREEEPNARRLSYGSERGHRLELGRALVTVPKTHEVPQIERPWALRVPYFNVVVFQEKEDPQRHFTIQEIKKLPEDAFLGLVRERLAGSNRFKDHALVFVHGYNTFFDDALYRTAQIAYDLKFDGAAFAYSWPSGGAVASYTYDRESAGAARPYLRRFLEMVVKETGAKAISVVAHSMGNQPLLEVLKDMHSAAPEGVVLNQMILAAPDVDADNFANLAKSIEGFAKGVTLYAASNDRALIISRNFWQNPRAGDVPASGPIIVSGVDTIDVTAASTDVFALNHSGYAENNELLQDIGKLIQSGLRPPDARLPNLKRVNTDKGDYWRYAAP
jgi:esterase/lipase superfamily enzyme